MFLKNKIDRNINQLYSVTEWIRNNEEKAVIGDVQTKTNFVKTLLFYENLRKDTLVLLDAYFKEEGNIVDFTTENSIKDLPKNDKIKLLSLDEAKLKYGEVENGVWKNESKWMVVYRPPEWFQSQVINTATGLPCKKIYMNKDMVAPFEEALSNVVNRGLQSELKTFDGCFLVRDVRGIPGKLSTHSYGLAIDLNANENGLGKDPTFSKELIQCFKDAGFKAGADFKRKDGMHFQFADW